MGVEVYPWRDTTPEAMAEQQGEARISAGGGPPCLIGDSLQAEWHQAVLEMRRMGILLEQERRDYVERFASLEAEIRGLKAELALSISQVPVIPPSFSLAQSTSGAEGGIRATPSQSRITRYPQAASSGDFLGGQPAEVGPNRFSKHQRGDYGGGRGGLNPPYLATNSTGGGGLMFARDLVQPVPPFKFSGNRADFLAWQDKWED